MLATPHTIIRQQRSNITEGALTINELIGCNISPQAPWRTASHCGQLRQQQRPRQQLQQPSNLCFWRVKTPSCIHHCWDFLLSSFTKLTLSSFPCSSLSLWMDASPVLLLSPVFNTISLHDMLSSVAHPPSSDMMAPSLTIRMATSSSLVSASGMCLRDTAPVSRSVFMDVSWTWCVIFASWLVKSSIRISPNPDILFSRYKHHHAP